jgi:hypothetical protein
MMRATFCLTLLFALVPCGGCLTDRVSARIRNEAFVGREFEFYQDNALFAPVYGRWAGTINEGSVVYHDFRFDGLLTPKSHVPLARPDPRYLRILVPVRAQSTGAWARVTETPRPARTQQVAILFLRWDSPASPETRVSREFWEYLWARHSEIRPIYFQNAHLVYLSLRPFEEFVIHRPPHRPTPPDGWRRVSVSPAIEWRVRRYHRWLFPHALYAAAWPADILTFPIQAVLAIVFGIE